MSKLVPMIIMNMMTRINLLKKKQNKEKKLKG